jgi:hypothetical protein
MRSSTAMLVILLCHSAPVFGAGDWVEQFQYGPFIFRSEFPLGGPKGVVRQVIQLRSDVEKTLQIKVGDKPIEINLFKNRHTYSEYLAARIPEGKNRRALYVKGSDRGRLYAFHSRDLGTDLRHECTHAMLHNALPFIPLWLDEGLAEYFEIVPNERAKPERMKKLRFRFKWQPSLIPLEAKRDLSDMGSEDYLQSWAWVHFMLHDSKQSRAVLMRYLHRIEQADPPGPLSRHVTAGIPNADARLKRHFRKWY